MKDLQKWVSALEKLGYKSYDTILNAKNYGLPQNRKRYFMISILGEYSYEFPNPINLKRKLKDFLEEEVDEKYYLSEKMVEYISATNEKRTGNNNGATVNKDIACTINTAPGQRRCDTSNYIADNLPDNADLQAIYGLRNLRIRKLTPKECMRLMGFQDKDTKAMYEAGLSDSAIYHCAGDSICVNVLVAIFATLFDKDYKEICANKNY